MCVFIKDMLDMLEVFLELFYVDACVVCRFMNILVVQSNGARVIFMFFFFYF